MINGLAVPAVQQPTFGVAQRNQQVRPPALDFASALPRTQRGFTSLGMRTQRRSSRVSMARRWCITRSVVVQAPRRLQSRAGPRTLDVRSGLAKARSARSGE
jgi:hypothetical protein